jgi:hypothetical protein
MKPAKYEPDYQTTAQGHELSQREFCEGTMDWVHNDTENWQDKRMRESSKASRKIFFQYSCGFCWFCFFHTCMKSDEQPM